MINAINNRVKILRPNLWSGSQGVIVTQYNDGGALVLAEGPSGTFHAKVKAGEFALTLWRQRNDMLQKKP